jgi:hypothetical protein
MRRRNPPTHDAAAQVRFSSTGLTRTTSWSEKIMSVVGLLVIKPMSQMGHFRTRVWVVAMSALPRVTDIVQRERNVRKVPRGDMGLSALVSVDPHQYCPRRCQSRPVHRSKQHLYSITSSASASSVGGTAQKYKTASRRSLRNPIRCLDQAAAMEAALFRFLSLRKSRLRGSMRSWHVRRHGNGTGDCHISGNLADCAS